ncbi:diguanylate cyclase with PAS/PAC sensor [Thermodesulfobium narugense DSM 14796]|uniref:Diguanylate cyclase with PAS/PAC sensor n=1 Tax=Thermodesulfobium narugense DSM 14796 TaxID=747365 RepID=M1E598_9BACT|nr:diguanylate cyclase [Thermodesulfobium narugense]AEE14927.1 diguanylate cyclase with PAS/PAC sensor [Thermodesulfobium narugense DSM 14796]
MRETSKEPSFVESIRKQLIGLGEDSSKKTYYGELREKIKYLERFRTLLDSSTDMILLINSQTKRLIDANLSAIKKLGYSVKELEKMSILEFINIKENECLELFDYSISKDFTKSLVTEFICKDSKKIPVEITITSKRFSAQWYYIIIARDITEKLAKEAEIKAKELRYAKILENISDLIIELSENFRILSITPSVFKILGYHDYEIIGHNFYEFVEDKDLNLVRSAFSSVVKDEHISFSIKNKKNTSIIVGASISKIKDDSTTYIVSLRDISEVSRIYRDLEEKERRFRVLFNNISEAVLLFPIPIKGQFEKFIEVNDTACAFLNMKKEEILNLTIKDIVAPGKEKNDLLEKLILGEFENSIQAEFISKNSQNIFVEIDIKRCHIGNQDMVLLIAKNVTEKRLMENKLNYLAFHDHLTGLSNRTLFSDRVQYEISRAKRNRTFLGVMFLDLDRFKDVNDTLGHKIGDSLLQHVSAKLQETIRETDILARMGGDEFAILVPDLKDKNEIKPLAKRILKLFENPFTVNNNSFKLGISIGISIYPYDAKNYEELLTNADTAMYSAKNSGGNKFIFYCENIL